MGQYHSLLFNTIKSIFWGNHLRPPFFILFYGARIFLGAIVCDLRATIVYIPDTSSMVPLNSTG